jgi:hypothetical protein
MKAEIKTEVNAGVTLSPKRSQLHAFIYNSFAGILVVIGCYFAWHANPNLWMPFTAAGVAAAMGLASHLATHRNTDMAGARDTAFTINEAGVTYSSDPRAPYQKEILLELSKAISKAATIKELPLADGLLDKEHNIVPGSKKEAEQISIKANKLAQELVNSTIELVTPLQVTSQNFIEGEAPRALEISHDGQNSGSTE